MLQKLRALKPNQDVSKSVNFHEEYLRALRSKSYIDFFDKAQFCIHSNQNKYSETLLQPDQETVHTIIDATILSHKPELKNLMLDYFHISAEASLLCGHLLKNINQIQCNYQFIQRALEIMDNDDDDSQEKLKLIIAELNSFILTNPFSNLEHHHFKLVSDENSSVLNRLNSMRKKLERNFKMKRYLKTLEFCVTVVCDMVAVTTHTLSSVVTQSLERELLHLRFSRRFLGKVCEQLDMATKGSYILKKDFDTMSRLVDRLYDDIEHVRAMVQLCLDKKIDKFCVQIVKELTKSDAGFGKKVEELKEHACLCLVTINRSRDLVTKEMAKMCA
ncbi:hypothetical protein DEO72_LG5g2619 [Vigna unguiculata]|uniref:Uncharacterized protein n=2 Tax=Vigna unguiculata TaxID=3917 RepID=A0A4D6M0D9_VIGUN|nr:hypothetical protein DEO72_LG5g2619 [Vigna unguiculata]